MIYENRGVKFVCDVDIDEREADAYIDRAIKRFSKGLIAIHAHIDGDYVELSYELEDIPFSRIRRITGYLVGTLERFNDAKRSEESDRVKHDVG